MKSPPPLDKVIPDYHDFIFIKEVDTRNGVLYLGGGGGGNVIHNFWYLVKGDEGDTKLLLFTFDLFTLNITIHYTVHLFQVFSFS